jgi:hypothetical protein
MGETLKSHFISRAGFLSVLLAMIVILGVPHTLSLADPSQVVQNQLLVYTELEPQPLSFLGFYDSLFPLHIMISVNNPTSRDFPGGNVTCHLAAPSGKWQSNRQYNVPSIPASQSYKTDAEFKVEESGVYVMTFDPSVTFSDTTTPYWAVSGGFLPVQVEPPSTLLMFLTLIILILGFVATDLTLIRMKKLAPTSRLTFQPAKEDLLKAINLFEAGKNIESYLLDPKDAVRFEAGVAWLLEILGFQAVRLNKGAHGEVMRVREGQAEVRSADILVHDPTNGKFGVVSCTIGMPSTEKRQKIRLTANEVRSRMGNCQPIMVSDIDAGSASEREAKQEGIVLIDKPKLVVIMELVRTERFEKARRYFDQ